MSTLPIRVSHFPQFAPLAGVGRVVAAVVTMLDVLAEARAQATAAHKRYPFADW